MLTNFQHAYLSGIVRRGINGQPVKKIIFAVTSANHENTRRNPTSLFLRVLAIDKFSRSLPCETRIYPIPDAKPTDKFAEYILRQVEYQSGEKLMPGNTVLACSTPPVIKLFAKLGFRNMPMELVSAVKEKYRAPRPYEVIDLMVAAGKRWRSDARWKKYAHPGTHEVYLQYGLGDKIQELFNDALLNDDADITDTRNYSTYAQSMDAVARLKFSDINPFIVAGKIVDVGCSTGSLIRLIAEEFLESDIIGIEATRKFYEFCRMQEYAHPFVFFYRRNITDQNFKANSINTFIYSSVTHEVYSYMGEKTLRNVLRHSYAQLANAGRIIIRDVVGPENPDAVVYLELNSQDGKKEGSVQELSTYQKFFQFVADFKSRKIRYKTVTLQGKALIRLRMQDAYEYISKMSYTDNWASEMHEEFGFYSFSRWKKELEKIGFRIVSGSKSFKNPYIINNKYHGRARLHTFKNGALAPEDYPPTNMILVGEK